MVTEKSIITKVGTVAKLHIPKSHKNHSGGCYCCLDLNSKDDKFVCYCGAVHVIWRMKKAGGGCVDCGGWMRAGFNISGSRWK